MRVLRGVAGKVLPCGCLAGVYETYAGELVTMIDARSQSCDHPEHQLHEIVSRQGRPGPGTGAGPGQPPD